MRSLASPTDHAHDEAVAFIAELVRLEGKIREVNQQLDRLEAEMSLVLGELAQERFEEYR